MSGGNYRCVRSIATYNPNERVPAVVPIGPTARAVRIVREGQASVVLPLVTSRDYGVGRSEEADLFFGDESVSRHHGNLYFSTEAFAWTFRDAASSNGTFFSETGAEQGERVRPGQLVAVAAGYTLQIGRTPTCRLEFLAEVPSKSVGVSHGEWKSPAAWKLEQQIQTASQHPMPVLLLGPKGSGKTSAASRIHQLSGLRGEYVELNCAHLPTDRVHLRSELLGHVKGAFTGANDPREGKLFQADGGTLFLDEVESMVEEAQAFLLNLLEGRGDLAPLGASPSKRRPPPKYRLISASKKPLEPPGFREDLAERLVGDIIVIPSLGERREDIPLFVALALEKLSAEQQVSAEVSADALAYRNRPTGDVLTAGGCVSGAKRARRRLPAG